MRSRALFLSLLASSFAAVAIACSSSSDNADDTTTSDAGNGSDVTTTGEAGPAADAGKSDASHGGDCTVTPCVLQVSVGNAHSCALIDDGTARCWGANAVGELGSGTVSGSTIVPASSPTPIAVPGLTNVVALSASGAPSSNQYTLAVLGDGTVVGFGDDTGGQLGDGVTSNALRAPSPATHVLVSDVRSLSNGVLHQCAVVGDGGIWCWGVNQYGELGVPSTGDDDFRGTPAPVGFSAGMAFTETSGGYEFECAVTADHHVWCWGIGGLGALGRAPTDGGAQDQAPAQVAGLDGVDHVAAGTGGACALKTDGSVVCWGEDVKTATTSSTTPSFDPTPTALTLPSGVTFTQIVPTLVGFCGLDANGNVWCWGDNEHAQMGSGYVDGGALVPLHVTTPTQVPGVASVTQIAGNALAGQVCARLRGGSVTCWGDDSSSQTGSAPNDAGTTYRLVPAPVAF